MAVPQKPKVYRDVIDELVHMCRAGQGQMGARRAREGLWNRSATAERFADQHEFNLLLARMPVEDREILARMLVGEVVRGVFESLKALEQFGVSPFVDGYEGSPFHDFIGRLDGWEWPKEREAEMNDEGPGNDRP